MKPDYNNRGISILENLLSNKAKTLKLIKVLDHFKLQINPIADTWNRNVAWIIPIK